MTTSTSPARTEPPMPMPQASEPTTKLPRAVSTTERSSEYHVQFPLSLNWIKLPATRSGGSARAMDADGVETRPRRARAKMNEGVFIWIHERGFGLGTTMPCGGILQMKPGLTRRTTSAGKAPRPGTRIQSCFVSFLSVPACGYGFYEDFPYLHAVGSGRELDFSRLSGHSPHDDQAKSVERLAVMGLKRFKT